MIYPHEIIVNEFNPDYDEYEARIDSYLESDWYEGESRTVDVLPQCRGRDCVHPVVYEMVRRYYKAGWKCKDYGYTAIIFYAPKRADASKKSSPGKETPTGVSRWWPW